jgi:hypothetical protein
METQAFLVKMQPLAGSTEERARKNALEYYQAIKRKTKRKPYIRAAFFEKQKIFLDVFWSHTFEKSRKVRAERFKLFPCAIELLEKTTKTPEIYIPTQKKSETWLRFFGRTTTGVHFVVQVKSRLGRFYLISVYKK